jgi:TolA-binding protein
MIDAANNPEDLLDAILDETASSIRSDLSASPEDELKNERAIAVAMGRLARPARRLPARAVWMVAAAAMLIVGVAAAQRWNRSHGSPALPSATPNDFAMPAPPVAPAAAPPESPSKATDIAEGPTANDVRAPAPDEAAKSTAHETAAQLFAEANELRRARKDGQAIGAYKKVERLFPTSPEAEQSYATLGSLLLEHGNAQDAVTQLDHYIERGGPLLVDVLAGKAAALQRLGRTVDEQRTWQMLLDRFPKSVQATRARARLAELH